MDASIEIPPIDTWLASRRLDFGPAPGQVQLTDGRIIFTVLAPPGKKNARWLEEVTGEAGLAERVLAGDTAKVLDVPAAEVELLFPSSKMGSAMQVEHDGTTYRISFYNSGTASRGGRRVASAAQKQAWVAAEPWREAFKPD